MSERRIIYVEDGCLDCPNRFSDSGTNYPEHRKDGSIKDIYCMADQPEERECPNEGFPDWCPLEDEYKVRW